jgi:hypothetical protein
MRHTLIATMTLTLLLACAADSRAVELARVSDVELEQTDSRLFSLDQPEEVKIRAVTFRTDRHDGYCGAWIIDRSTRASVWSLEDASVSRKRSRIIIYRDEVDLPAGEYELYYTATLSYRTRHRGWLDWLMQLWIDEDEEEVAVVAGELGIEVNADSGSMLGVNSPGKVRERLGQGAIAALTAVGDNESLNHAFALASPVEVEIYAIGEADDDGTYDRAMIIDLDSGERIWELDYWGSERAGGDKKNRLVRTTMTLPAGSYAVTYATDSSHSWPYFNAEPPFDPMAWGVTVRPLDQKMLAQVSAIEYQDPLQRNLIVDLTRIEDNRHMSRGFTLKRPTPVRVHAVGEGDDGDMFDYGWIINAHSRETVWKMAHAETEHAGGGSKNRLADDRFELAAGSYIVHYVTDGSHAYKDWNSAPPTRPELWGITVVGTAESFSEDDVEPYNPVEDPALLAQIAAVRNRAHETDRFSLDAAHEVLIYALGEGSRNAMYDYGWIEDDSGRVVWEMSFAETEHAGGTDKNRMFRGRVALQPGSYKVHYVTDGSHAYRRWNAAPPHDPESWGILVIR